MIEKKLFALNLTIKPDDWLSEVIGYKSGEVKKTESNPKKENHQTFPFYMPRFQLVI